ncbi:MAG: hypothetical protein MUE75_01055 [Algoriphagus sp.]|jgi:hypothetical protein|nr:hypothetical protein [Algoriphagus sp.]
MLKQIPLQELSSTIIWIPLILAGLRAKTGDQKLRLFFLFLLFGALTDGTGWLVYRVLDPQVFGKYHQFLQFAYLWFECLFFIWLAFEFLQTLRKSYWRKVFCLMSSLFFLVEVFLRFGVNNPVDTYTSVIVSGLLVLNSFLMAFALLGLAERKEEILSEPWFWILSGIFFYSFSCFFIDMLSYTNMAAELWRLRSLLNIIQYLFFVVGLVKLKNDQ